MPTKNQTAPRPRRDAVALAVDVLSDRWTFLILREAFFGVRRYGQMQRNLGIARNVLADRLRRLVEDGMFERVRYRTDPDWYEYRLTERALDLYPAIVALMRWADTHMAAEEPAPAEAAPAPAPPVAAVPELELRAAAFTIGRVRGHGAVTRSARRVAIASLMVRR